MENGMWPLNETKKTPPRATMADGNNNIKKNPVSTVQEVIHIDDEALSSYEYVELTTTESESSQHLDPDSLDDDGHKDTALYQTAFTPPSAMCESLYHPSFGTGWGEV